MMSSNHFTDNRIRATPMTKSKFVKSTPCTLVQVSTLPQVVATSLSDTTKGVKLCKENSYVYTLHFNTLSELKVVAL